MEELEYTVIIPEYLDNPLTEEEEKEFFNDQNLIDKEENEIDSQTISYEEYEKLYDDYMYQKSLNEYNVLTQENNERVENYLNQIANCSIYTLGFVGFFVLMYLLALIVKFFKSILGF